MLSLEEIAQKYEAVDNNYGSDKNTSHCYIDTYTRLFEGRREQTLNILEIGIFSGASLQIWSEYFPSSNIVGCDIDLGPVKFGQTNPSIKMFLSDATTEEGCQIVKQNGPYDIIIDDGAHTQEAILASINLLASSLRDKDSQYVIEDIDLNRFPNILEEIRETSSQNGLSCEIIDLRSIKNRFDDVMAVLQKV